MTKRKEKAYGEIRGKPADSPEEIDFAEWCMEAAEAGMLATWDYHPPAFPLSDSVFAWVDKKLKTKTNMVKRLLMHPHEYTADFVLEFSAEGAAMVRGAVRSMRMCGITGDDRVYVDVKGAFSQFHEAKIFSINQKWVFNAWRVYVHKVVPEEWFGQLWLPRNVAVSRKTGKPRKKYAGFRSFDDLLAGRAKP